MNVDSPAAREVDLTALTASTRPELPIPELQLLPGETLIREGRPSAVLRLKLLATNTLVGALTVLMIPFLPALWWAVLRSVAVHRYWLTDRRLVVRTGVIGYQMRSIPLSRIVDVSVKTSWLDQLLGLTHIDVRDMTGESGGDGLSRGVQLFGVDRPDLWVEELLGRSGGPLDGDRDATQLDTMVGLLQELVAKAA